MVMEKQKAYAFTTPNLEFCSPSSNRRKNRWRRRRYGEEGWSVFRPSKEERVVLCENEEEWRGIYREGRVGKFGHLGWVWVGNWFWILKVCGVYEVGLWGRVDGCEWWSGDREERLRWLVKSFGEECLWDCVKEGWEEVSGGRWGSCGVHRSWGDPVWSTDPEVFKDLQSCTKLGMQNALAHNSGRSAPDWCLFWALNAHL